MSLIQDLYPTISGLVTEKLYSVMMSCLDLKTYLFKLPGNNKDNILSKFMNIDSKNGGLLSFIPSESTKAAFKEQIDEKRTYFYEKELSGIAESDEIVGVHADALCFRTKQKLERLKPRHQAIKCQTIIEAIAVQLRMWIYSDELSHEGNVLYFLHEVVASYIFIIGSDFVTLTSDYNEAFILACLFNWCNGANGPTLGFPALKATASSMVKYVKVQRKRVTGEMATFLKAERKELFKEWGLAEDEVLRDPGIDRDSMGRFSVGNNFSVNARAGVPVRTIEAVIAGNQQKL